MSVTPTYGWPTPDDSDLVKDGAAAIRLLGDAIDETLPTVTIPVGGIILWSGLVNQLPDGWQLCDGSNGTPNLRDRFVVGAGGQYPVGSVGGQASTTLTTQQLPAHTHARGTLTTGSNGTHKHILPERQSNAAGGNSLSFGRPSGGFDSESDENMRETGAHTHTISGSTASTGSGSAVENRPPYYALAYIMRVS